MNDLNKLKFALNFGENNEILEIKTCNICKLKKYLIEFDLKYTDSCLKCVKLHKLQIKHVLEFKHCPYVYWHKIRKYTKKGNIIAKEIQYYRDFPEKDIRFIKFSKKIGYYKKTSIKNIWKNYSEQQKDDYNF